jgi:predicted amidophosphoribosyltransferase
MACENCLAELPATARLVRPTPTPEGLLDCYSVTEYGGLSKEMILWHKERRAYGLARPLGVLLAQAVDVLLTASHPSSHVRILLVPAPSRSAAVRSRGHDPLRVICLQAAGLLRAVGWRTQSVPLLKLRMGVLDQSGLDAQQRMDNLTESMTLSKASHSALVRVGEPVLCVVCDDILTTGATVRECQRALQETGLPVTGIATIAHTVKRGPEWPASRLPFSSIGH